MSRKYDPQHVFNHRRTRVQQKGQTQQVKLLDEAPPRVDDQILDKAYRLCKAYNKIPQPILADLPVEGELVLGFNQFFAAGSRFYSVQGDPTFDGLVEGQSLTITSTHDETIPLFHWMRNINTIVIVNQLTAYDQNTVSIFMEYLDANNQSLGYYNTSAYSNGSTFLPSSYTCSTARGINYNDATHIRLYATSASANITVKIQFFRIVLQ